MSLHDDYPQLAQLVGISEGLSSLEDMANLLAKHPDGERAASDTVRILVLAESLGDVWEYAAGVGDGDCDYEPGELTAALAKYNSLGDQVVSQ